jgi:hypothetical protein
VWERWELIRLVVMFFLCGLDACRLNEIHASFSFSTHWHSEQCKAGGVKEEKASHLWLHKTTSLVHKQKRNYNCDSSRKLDWEQQKWGESPLSVCSFCCHDSFRTKKPTPICTPSITRLFLFSLSHMTRGLTRTMNPFFTSPKSCSIPLSASVFSLHAHPT